MDAEQSAKHARLVEVLDLHGLDELRLTRPGNVAWYTGGARVHVVEAVDQGVAEVTVARDGAVLHTDAIEAPRLEAEELGRFTGEVRVRPWFAPAADVPAAGTDRAPELAAAVDAARAALTPPELERYRVLCRDAAAALTDVAQEIAPEWTEGDAARAVAAAHFERGMDFVVLLVAGEERLPRFRHPLPTSAPLGRRAMLVTCARREGLIASVTRIVAFGGLSAAERDGYPALLAVEAAFLESSRPGARLGDAFAAGRDAYAAHGFAPDEWHRHHQGGPLGYFARDVIATADAEQELVAGQCVAWNPSAPGLKVEDTVLMTQAGHEVLSVDPRWPTVTVAGRERPEVLAR